MTGEKKPADCARIVRDVKSETGFAERFRSFDRAPVKPNDAASVHLINGKLRRGGVWRPESGASGGAVVC